MPSEYHHPQRPTKLSRSNSSSNSHAHSKPPSHSHSSPQSKSSHPRRSNSTSHRGSHSTSQRPSKESRRRSGSVPDTTRGSRGDRYYSITPLQSPHSRRSGRESEQESDAALQSESKQDEHDQSEMYFIFGGSYSRLELPDQSPSKAPVETKRTSKASDSSQGSRIRMMREERKPKSTEKTQDGHRSRRKEIREYREEATTQHDHRGRENTSKPSKRPKRPPPLTHRRSNRLSHFYTAYDSYRETRNAYEKHSKEFRDKLSTGVDYIRKHCRTLKDINKFCADMERRSKTMTKLYEARAKKWDHASSLVIKIHNNDELDHANYDIRHELLRRKEHRNAPDEYLEILQAYELAKEFWKTEADTLEQQSKRLSTNSKSTGSSGGSATSKIMSAFTKWRIR